MVIGLILILAIASAAVVVWFFSGRNPERAATHEDGRGRTAQAPERSRFAPGDAGTESQPVRDP